MGREIRRVPPNWEHPRNESGNFQPMFDRSFQQAVDEWKKEFAEWEAGEKQKNKNDDGSVMEYWEWSGDPPDRAYYRTYSDEEATWFQLYETVSEGTPLSPPFATKEELAKHLAEHGDDWKKIPWGIEKATAFVESGWAPSFVVAGGVIYQGEDVPMLNKSK